MVFENYSAIVGGTPLLRLKNINKNILAKLELMNPAGSAKDRVALAMIEDAEKRGTISAGAVIIEPTSGNTGVGLAAVCAPRGYRVILTMPDTMSTERRALLRAYGAEVVLTKGAEGMSGAVAKALELHENTPNSFIPSQFDNPANPMAHYTSTGPEIWLDADRKVDIFVACVGTGGTLSGTGRYLKEQNPDIKIIAVEPAASPLLSEGRSGSHGIQGIGANFIPKNLDQSLIDEVAAVTDGDALAAMKELAEKEGIFAGISSGAALCAAKMLISRPENRAKTIVTILPDTGERYLSVIDR